MTVYHWILLFGFILFLFFAVSNFFIALLKKGRHDPSVARGKQSAGIIYSFTAAMSPAKKESAYLHLPTYTAGLIFHFGTFLSLLWLIFLFFGIALSQEFITGSVVIIIAGAVCGLGIFFKRAFRQELRQMSDPDDYFSNLLVTFFQILMSLTLIFKWPVSILFIYSALLFLYMPVGKLRHAVYFFVARIHLGKYFGKRGVWPVK